MQKGRRGCVQGMFGIRTHSLGLWVDRVIAEATHFLHPGHMPLQESLFSHPERRPPSPGAGCGCFRRCRGRWDSEDVAGSSAGWASGAAASFALLKSCHETIREEH